MRPVIEEIVDQPEQNSSQPDSQQELEQEHDPKLAEEKAQEFISQPPPSRSSQSKTNFKLILLITIITALIVGFVAGGIYVYFSGLSDANQTVVTPTPTPESSKTPAPTPALTPTPEPVEPSEYSISVLNGSGRIGAAGELSQILEDGDYVVDNIGNASRYDFEETVVQLTPDVPASLGLQLKTLLSDSYEVIVGKELAENNQYDVVITVGSSLAK